LVVKLPASPIFYLGQNEALMRFGDMKGREMRLMVFASTIAIMAASSMGIAQAEPGGCLKYGAVGAVGGHVAGHHAVLGAVGGCAVGMYKRHEYRKHHKQEMRDQTNG
jgi:hypothetical protein